ncbi:MAG: hypothetical protein AAB075_00890 [Gemmatimonadota bacterium]
MSLSRTGSLLCLVFLAGLTAPLAGQPPTLRPKQLDALKREATRYGSYLEQLGVTYPTLRAP